MLGNRLGSGDQPIREILTCGGGRGAPEMKNNFVYHSPVVDDEMVTVVVAGVVSVCVVASCVVVSPVVTTAGVVVTGTETTWYILGIFIKVKVLVFCLISSSLLFI